MFFVDITFHIFLCNFPLYNILCTGRNQFISRNPYPIRILQFDALREKSSAIIN